MRLLCDENVKYSIVALLQQEGYETTRVQDVLELGDEDATIVDNCRETGRILLTNDADFFDFDGHPGVFFLDEQGTPARDVVTAIQRIERLVSAAELRDHVWHVPDGWI